MLKSIDSITVAPDFNNFDGQTSLLATVSGFEVLPTHQTTH